MERYVPKSKLVFYVYEHWRPDTDVCFHVGKGKDNRAYRFEKNRNNHYLNIVRKLTRLGMCVEVRMVASGLPEHKALALEIERIAFWRSVGVRLTNVTDGGEGTSGLKHKEETKRILRAKSIAAAARIAADPEASAALRKLRSKIMTELLADPAARLLKSEIMTEIMRDPNVRKARSKSMIEIMKDPAVRLGRSQKQKSIIADRKERERRGRLISESWQDPESRENRVESMKATWKDPEIAARRSVGIRKALAQPEEQARRAEQMRLRMQDPAYLEKLLIARRERAAREAKAKALRQPDLFRILEPAE